MRDMFLWGFLLANLYAVATCWPNGDPVAKKRRPQQCTSEGRIADPDDCGQFYDCIRRNDNEIIAHSKTCLGHAFNPTSRACAPIRTVQGCAPYSTRSFNVADPELQHLCANSTNTFRCADCQTLVICIDGKPYTDTCSQGSVCSVQNSFSDAVCYPGDPTECTCDADNFYRQDHYNPSKFISCGLKGSEPMLLTCPDGFVFNNEQGTCCTADNSSCSASGAYAVKGDCSKYYSYILTVEGWVQKEITCRNNTMFNEDTGKCEDPCAWHTGDFICQSEGRYAKLSDCKKYYECIIDPVYSDRFIQNELSCPDGYIWSQTVKSGYGHCVSNVSAEATCVPQNIKLPQCQIPKDWCTVPSAMQCSAENGFCLDTGDRCNGTINVLQNSLEDRCFCCVRDKQASPTSTTTILATSTTNIPSTAVPTTVGPTTAASTTAAPTTAGPTTPTTPGSVRRGVRMDRPSMQTPESA